jgi:hypothetical protein
MHLSTYVQNLAVDHMWRSATWPKSTARWFALFSTPPSDDTGAGAVELVGGSYARAQLDASDTNYAATQGGTSGASSGTTSPGTTSNVVAINFPNPTANWAPATHFGVYDASSGGNLLGWDALDQPMTVHAGDTQIRFAAGAFIFTID